MPTYLIRSNGRLHKRWAVRSKWFQQSKAKRTINSRAAVWQLQSKVVETVRHQCIVWISLDTSDMRLYVVERSLVRAV